ncbi:hypothetical protein [Reichenbachiella agariperforans]|uniref:hypothetical protein n=1 Tax=Reichenbachiella agariperforans TaxID=156994 RepID=UPI001C0910CB|nr:hypothetical protein [Reichenbachiella agariperforans]MBU2913754.1 hypothetical protein [Reichenbachiella agariperforans]
MQLIKFGFAFLSLIVFSYFSAVAQEDEATYLKAKEYFQAGDYTFAMEYFRKVSANPKSSAYKIYASFYYALSAYEAGELYTAKSMWLQMSQKYPSWPNQSDVNYWLSEVYFQEDDLANGVLYAKKSGLPEGAKLMSQQLAKIDNVEQLEILHYQFPNDELVAKALATRIASKPVSFRNNALLDGVVEKFELNPTEFGRPDIGESQLKDTYQVAVLLPFMFDGLDNPRRTVRNRFVMDLFHGMREAADRLNQDGKRVELLAYDTRRDSAETAKLLMMPEMKGMDLIIGPLFPMPSKLVADFSFQNKINMINPLSTSTEVIGSNPFSFLFNSSIEARALTAAQIAIDSVNNKNAMIFYEDNKRDSLSAYTYAQRIMEHGFEVVMLEPVRDTTVRATYDLLTAKYERRYSEEQKDSILNDDPTRIIKQRRSIKEKDVIDYYEEFFRIAPDSIGHIYVASSETLIASNYISALEIRADSTKIIGRGEWRDSETLTLEEMERLGVYYIDPMFEEMTKPAYMDFRRNYMSRYKKLPSQNVMIGYDLMTLVGDLMIKYGNYFQQGTVEEGFVPGQIFMGVLYGTKNYNQYVPVTQFSESELRIVNKPSDGKREE